MKKILLGIAALLLAAVGVLAALVFSQPDAIDFERTIQVDAHPEDVRPLARDLKNFNRWSPWKDLDPELVQAYSPETAGVGAWYTWEGNDDVGKGKMAVTGESETHVAHQMDFVEPFEDTATSKISWKAEGDTTSITWAFHQEATLSTKLALVFLDIPAMLTKDFDKGLAQLEPLVEQARHAREADEETKRQAEKLMQEAAALTEKARVMLEQVGE